VITGGTGPNTLLVTAGDISQATITGVATLEVNGSVTMTAAQAVSFGSIVKDTASSLIGVSDTFANTHNGTNLQVLLNLMNAGKLSWLKSVNTDGSYMTTVFTTTGTYWRADNIYNAAGQLSEAVQYNNDGSYVFTLGALTVGINGVGGGVKNTFVVNQSLAAGTVITGGTGPNTLLVTAGDISQATITGVATLEVNGSVTMTAAQAVSFGSIVKDTAISTLKIADTASNVLTNLGVLQNFASASQFDALSVTDNNPLLINASQATLYTAALAKLTGTYTLGVTDTAANINNATNHQVLVNLINANKLNWLKTLNTDGSASTRVFAAAGASYFATDYLYTPSGQQIEAVQYNNDGSVLYTLGGLPASINGGTAKNTFVVNQSLAAGTVITGGTGPNTLLVTAGDISQATITGVATLEVNGWVGLTATQFAAFGSLTGDAASNTIKATTNGTYSLQGITNAFFNLDASSTAGPVTLIGGVQSGETLTAGTGIDTLTTGTGANTTINAFTGDTA
jgi:hypothetical protein